MKKYDKMYLDMDGVLADFDLSFTGLSGMEPSAYESKYGKDAFWEKIYEDPNFFKGLLAYGHLDSLLGICERYSDSLCVLSSPSRVNTPLCMIQKRDWVDSALGPYFPAIFTSNKGKYAGANKVLIDDTPKKIDDWVKKGGIGYLFDPKEPLSKLEEFLKKGLQDE